MKTKIYLRYGLRGLNFQQTLSSPAKNSHQANSESGHSRDNCRRRSQNFAFVLSNSIHTHTQN